MSIRDYFYSRINCSQKFIGINQAIPVNIGPSQIMSALWKEVAKKRKCVFHILEMPVTEMLFEVKQILCS